MINGVFDEFWKITHLSFNHYILTDHVLIKMCTSVQISQPLDIHEVSMFRFQWHVIYL